MAAHTHLSPINSYHLVWSIMLHMLLHVLLRMLLG